MCVRLSVQQTALCLSVPFIPHHLFTEYLRTTLQASAWLNIGKSLRSFSFLGFVIFYLFFPNSGQYYCAGIYSSRKMAPTLRVRQIIFTFIYLSLEIFIRKACLEVKDSQKNKVFPFAVPGPFSTAEMIQY